MNIKKVTIEYLNTMNQGGIVGSDNTLSRLRGQDNYFGNGTYRNGWTYNSHILGTPFITKMIDIDHNTFIANRLEAYYIGLKGIINRFPINLIMSYKLNKGSYNNSIYQEKVIFLLQTVFILKNSFGINTSLALDNKLGGKSELGIALMLKKGFY